MGFWQGRFRVASGIEVGPMGRVYVADFYNNRVQVFSGEGAYIESFGEGGAGPGELKGPTGVAVNADGDVYVADWGNHRVQMFRRSD